MANGDYVVTQGRHQPPAHVYGQPGYEAPSIQHRRDASYTDPRTGHRVYPIGNPDSSFYRNVAAMHAQGLKAPSWMNATEKMLYYAHGGRLTPDHPQWNAMLNLMGQHGARARRARYSDFLAEHGGMDPNRYVPTTGRRPTYRSLQEQIELGWLPEPRVPINPNPPEPWRPHANFAHGGWEDGQHGWVMPKVIEPGSGGLGGPPPGTDPPQPGGMTTKPPPGPVRPPLQGNNLGPVVRPPPTYAKPPPMPSPTPVKPPAGTLPVQPPGSLTGSKGSMPDFLMPPSDFEVAAGGGEFYATSAERGGSNTDSLGYGGITDPVRPVEPGPGPGVTLPPIAPPPGAPPTEPSPGPPPGTDPPFVEPPSQPGPVTPGPPIDVDILPPATPGAPSYTPRDLSGQAQPGAMSGPMEWDIPPVGPAPPPTSSGTADPTPTEWEVTPEQTVAGQLESLYDRDSPFFEQARQRAIRQHLSQGGQNTAMAAAFGELAAMDTAFKVASEDAAIYARSGEFNAAMKNQFSLAEQRFIHNALLSDQSFRQAGALQTQRLDAQMQAIALDYRGRSNLMDQELDHWMLQAAQSYEYNLGQLYAQADIVESQAGRDFARTMVLNGMSAMTNFYTNAFNAVLQYANNPNFTPEQQAQALREGMQWASGQFDLLQAFWGQWAAGGPPLSMGGWMGFGGTEETSNWWAYPYNPVTGEPNPAYTGDQTPPPPPNNQGGRGFLGGSVTQP